MRRCIESDTKLVNRLLDQKKYVIYRCKNGLIDAATSVVVKGAHIANILVGQVFCEPPDLIGSGIRPWNSVLMKTAI
jgi:ligand-binding sensor protein